MNETTLAYNEKTTFSDKEIKKLYKYKKKQLNLKIKKMHVKQISFGYFDVSCLVFFKYCGIMSKNLY